MLARTPAIILLLFCIIQPVIAGDEQPSLDLLEYLGELEADLNGEIINPLELQLSTADTQGEEQEDE